MKKAPDQKTISSAINRMTPIPRTPNTQSVFIIYAKRGDASRCVCILLCYIYVQYMFADSFPMRIDVYYQTVGATIFYFVLG